jgi:hypothetical protein
MQRYGNSSTNQGRSRGTHICNTFFSWVMAQRILVGHWIGRLLLPIIKDYCFTQIDRYKDYQSSCTFQCKRRIFIKEIYTYFCQSIILLWKTLSRYQFGNISSSLVCMNFLDRAEGSTEAVFVTICFSINIFIEYRCPDSCVQYTYCKNWLAVWYPLYRNCTFFLPGPSIILFLKVYCVRYSMYKTLKIPC